MEQVEDRVRERLLREATRQFAAHGVSGTSIQRVAAAAGVTRPTLVYHFGSKEGLRDAVLQAMVDHWRLELPRLLAAAASSGGPRLDALVGAMLGFFHQDPDLARLVVREMLDRPGALAVLVRTHLQPWTRLLAEAIRLGQASGTVRPDVDPESFVVLVISAALSMVAVGAHASALIEPEPTLDAQQAELIRLARAALLVPSLSPAPVPAED